MKNNRFFLAVIVGAVVMFLLGWVIYGMALKNFMVANSGLAKDIQDKVWKPMDKPEAMFLVMMLVANLIGALLFTVIAQWANARSFGAGLKVGAIVGILFSLNLDISFYALTYMYTPMLIVGDVAAGTVMMAITTGVIGMILGSGKTAS